MGRLQEIAVQDLQLQLNAWGIALDQSRKKETPPGTSAGREGVAIVWALLFHNPNSGGPRLQAGLNPA
jgi:hypothetical protein